MLKYYLLLIFLIVGCTANNSTISYQPVITPDEAEPQSLEKEDKYNSEYDRFIDNVTISAKTPYYITYQYKDVRIDEIAFLASRYCAEQNGKKAFLKNNITYKNF